MTILIVILLLFVLLLCYLVFSIMNQLYDIEDILIRNDFSKGGFDVLDITT